MKDKPCLGRGRLSLRASRLVRVTVLVALAAGLPLALQTASASPGATKASASASTSSYPEPLCESHSSLCRDVYDNPGDEYVGHDEPRWPSSRASPDRATT